MEKTNVFEYEMNHGENTLLLSIWKLHILSIYTRKSRLNKKSIMVERTSHNMWYDVICVNENGFQKLLIKIWHNGIAWKIFNRERILNYHPYA